MPRISGRLQFLPFRGRKLFLRSIINQQNLTELTSGRQRVQLHESGIRINVKSERGGEMSVLLLQEFPFILTKQVRSKFDHDYLHLVTLKTPLQGLDYIQLHFAVKPPYAPRCRPFNSQRELKNQAWQRQVKPSAPRYHLFTRSKYSHAVRCCVRKFYLSAG